MCAWYTGVQERVINENVNAEFAALKGNLTEEEAQKWLVKYLKNNIGIAAKLLLNIDLLPFQEIIITGMFKRDYSMLIISRGGSKSFCVAVFVSLFAIFEPGTDIALISKTFRQSRLIMQSIEKFMKDPGAALFNECLSKEPSHKNDEWVMEFSNNARIIALPLGDGNKLRGYRFKCICIDEFLLVPKKIVEEVLMPFLATNANPEKRVRQRKTEDALIKQGKMLEKDRVKFKNPKMICMSSASYKFEFLYKKYQEYVDNIMNGYQIAKNEDGTETKKPLDGTYFIAQLAYSSLPDALYNQAVIEAAKKSMSAASLAREYGSQFSDDSSGYFSARALNICTAQEGSEETTEVIGDPECEYLVTIDPSASENETSDFFAMTVQKVLPNGKYQIVNNYGVAGGKLPHHIAYLLYILLNFNVKFIMLDNAGGVTFIRACNESDMFKSAKIEIDLISNADIKLAEVEPVALRENIRELKKVYNSSPSKFKAYCIYFSGDWIRASNELLQSDINKKSILFSAGLETNSSKYNGALESLSSKKELDFLKVSNDDNEVKNSISDKDEDDIDLGSRSAKAQMMIERQDALIPLAKLQIAMIEPRQNQSGGIIFDLAPEMKRQKGADRPRRDIYTTIFMAAWVRDIWEMMSGMNIEDEDMWGDFVPLSF